MVFGAFCFSLMSLGVKYVNNIPILEIIFFRSVPCMIITPIILKKKKIPFFGKNKLLIIIRSLFSFFVIICFFYSIQNMDLTDAVTLKQLSPFFVIFLSSLLLKEKISVKNISIFILTFVASLLIIKPGLRPNVLPAIIGLIGAMLTGISHVALRHLRYTDHPLVIVNYLGYIVGFLSLSILLWQKRFYIPDILNLLLIFCIGIAGLGGHYCIALAYQKAPASLISCYSYLQIAFSALFSIFIFSEIPGIFTILGVFLVILGGYFNYKMRDIDYIKRNTY